MASDPVGTPAPGGGGPGFRVRDAREADRRFIEWMDELTETWGDESRPLPEDYAATRELYVGRWTEEQGGVVIEMASPSADALDPGDPLVAEVLRASRRGAAFGPSGAVMPVGCAWLRAFTEDEPGWGWYAPDVPEMAIAIRPGLVGRGLSRMLLSGLLVHARAAGHPAVSLAVEHGNERAARAYRRAGFEFAGPSPKGGHDVMVHRLGR